jgi:hypothetical protein
MHLNEWSYQRKPLRPLLQRREMTEITRKDNASEKRPRKEKTEAPRKSKKVIQPEVEQHRKNANDPQFSSQACYINETRI